MFSGLVCKTHIETQCFMYLHVFSHAFTLFSMKSYPFLEGPASDEIGILCMWSSSRTGVLGCCLVTAGFPEMGLPQARWRVYFRENPNQEWMMKWGTPILGHLHIQLWCQKQTLFDAFLCFFVAVNAHGPTFTTNIPGCAFKLLSGFINQW